MKTPTIETPMIINRMMRVLRSRRVLAAPTRVLRTRSGTVAASGVGEGVATAAAAVVGAGWVVGVGNGVGIRVGVGVEVGSGVGVEWEYW